MRAGTIPEGRPDSRAVALGLVPNTFDGWQTFEYWRGAPASPDFLMPQFGPEYARGFTALWEEIKKNPNSNWAYDFLAWNSRAYNPKFIPAIPEVETIAQELAALWQSGNWPAGVTGETLASQKITERYGAAYVNTYRDPVVQRLGVLLDSTIGTKESWLSGALDNATRFGIGTPARIREAADKVWALPATAFFPATSTISPPPSPTPPPASPPPPPPSGAFAPGDRVRVNTTVNTSLNVRASGSTSAAISCTQPSGSLGTVTVDSPVTANGYTWWNINYDNGCDGWSAGNYLVKDSGIIAVPNNEVNYARPPPSYSPPAYSPAPSASSTLYSKKFKIGDYVETTGSTNVRSEEGTSARLLTTYSAGVRGTVVGGPRQETGGAWWWQVHFTTSAGSVLVGWSAEQNLEKADINAPVGTAGTPDIAIDCYDQVANTFYNCANPPPSGGGTGAINITFTANPSTIVPGGYSGITWNATGASTCTFSNSSTPGSATYANFGGISVSPSQTTTYSLNCTGANGSATKSLTVTVGVAGATQTQLEPFFSPPASGNTLNQSNLRPFWKNLKFEQIRTLIINGDFVSQLGDIGRGVPDHLFALRKDPRAACIMYRQQNATANWPPGYGENVVVQPELLNAGLTVTTPIPEAWSDTPAFCNQTSPPVQPPASAKFQIGDSVQTTANLNVRQTANGTILGNQASGNRGTVIGPSDGRPVSAGGYNWWQIDYASGADGWSGENYLVKVSSADTCASAGSSPCVDLKVGKFFSQGTVNQGTGWGNFADGPLAVFPGDIVALKWTSANVAPAFDWNTGDPRSSITGIYCRVFHNGDSLLNTVLAIAQPTQATPQSVIKATGENEFYKIVCGATGGGTVTDTVVLTPSTETATPDPNAIAGFNYRWLFNDTGQYSFAFQAITKYQNGDSSPGVWQFLVTCQTESSALGFNLGVTDPRSVQNSTIRWSQLSASEQTKVRSDVNSGLPQSGSLPQYYPQSLPFIPTWMRQDQLMPDANQCAYYNQQLPPPSTGAGTGTGTTPPLGASNINFDAEPPMIVTGDSSVLSWSGVTESSCGVYNNTTGQALASNIAASGSATVSPTATTMYNLVCGQSTRKATVYIAQSLTTGTPAIGKIIELATATNVRSQPTTSGTLLGSQPAGARALVIGDSSAQADGYTWWNVDFRNASLPLEDNWSQGSTPHLTGWSIGNFMKEIVKRLSRSYDYVCINRLVDPARYYAINNDNLYKCIYYKEVAYFSNNTVVTSTWIVGTIGGNWLFWSQWTDLGTKIFGNPPPPNEDLTSIRKWEDLTTSEQAQITQESSVPPVYTTTSQ